MEKSKGCEEYPEKIAVTKQPVSKGTVGDRSSAQLGGGAANTGPYHAELGRSTRSTCEIPIARTRGCRILIFSKPFT